MFYQSIFWAFIGRFTQLNTLKLGNDRNPENWQISQQNFPIGCFDKSVVCQLKNQPILGETLALNSMTVAQVF